MSDSINIKILEKDLPQGKAVQDYLKQRVDGFEFDEELDLKEDFGYVPCKLKDIEAGFEYSAEYNESGKSFLLSLSYYTESDLRCAQLVAKAIYDLSGNEAKVDPEYDSILDDFSSIYDSLLNDIINQSEAEKRRSFIESKYSDYELAEAHAMESLDRASESKINEISKKGQLLFIKFSSGDYVCCKSWGSTKENLKTLEGYSVSNISRVKSNLLIELQGGEVITCQRHNENFAVKIYPAIYSEKYDAFFHLAWNGVHASPDY